MTAAVLLAVSGWFALRSRGVATPAAPLRPVTVLVANFENRAHDPLFDGLIEQAVGVGIEGASFVSTYPAVTRSSSRPIKSLVRH